MLVPTKVLIAITIAVCVCAGVAVALYLGLNNHKSSQISTNGDVCTSTKDYEMVTGLSRSYYIDNKTDQSIGSKNTNVESIEECQTLCDNNDDCKMFTFTEKEGTDPSYCNLYKNLNQFYYNNVDQNCISGIKCTEDCICDGTMIQFNNFNSNFEDTPTDLVKDVSGDSYEECMKSCNSNSTCKFIITHFDDDNNFICEGYDKKIPKEITNDSDEFVAQLQKLSDEDTDTTPYNYAFKKDDNQKSSTSSNDNSGDDNIEDDNDDGDESSSCEIRNDVIELTDKKCVSTWHASGFSLNDDKTANCCYSGDLYRNNGDDYYCGSPDICSVTTELECTSGTTRKGLCEWV